MRLQLTTLAVAVLLGISLWFQVMQNGELKAVNRQYESSIDDMNAAILERHQRYIETDQLLANSRRDYQIIQRQAQDIEHALSNQQDACSNSVIPDAVVSRVLEFQPGQD